MAGFLRKLGQRAGPRARKVQWLWQSLTGSEADAIRAEHAVGRDMAAEVRRQMPPDPDAQAAGLVADIGARLARCVTNRLRTFQAEVVLAEAPNAFALPGGFVFVTRPLVDLCEGAPDEIAFVLGHEMAHVIRGHAIDRVLASSATVLAARAVPGPGAAAAWLRHVGVRYLEGAYSRGRELDADELGVRLADAAGYGRAGAQRLLQRLAGLHEAAGDGALGLGPYFASHPPAAERIRHVQQAPPV